MGFGVDVTTHLVSSWYIHNPFNVMNLISRQGKFDVLLAIGSGYLHYTS